MVARGGALLEEPALRRYHLLQTVRGDLLTKLGRDDDAREGFERAVPGVIDETPGADESIDAVMAAQKDLVEILPTLHQVVCVKG